jgi:hypothetical protein
MVLLNPPFQVVVDDIQSRERCLYDVSYINFVSPHVSKEIISINDDSRFSVSLYDQTVFVPICMGDINQPVH